MSQVAVHGLEVLGGCGVLQQTCHGCCPSLLSNGFLLLWANCRYGMLARLGHRDRASRTNGGGPTFVFFFFMRGDQYTILSFFTGNFFFLESWLSIG
jgi:hypothetical protein